jgi:hypothetical protein
VGRVGESTLSGEELILDSAAIKFIQALDGWLPGHEKVIFASYSGSSLTAFAKRAMDFGRSMVPSVIEDGFWLKELRVSLERSGARDQNIKYFLNAASYGIFFHFSGLGRDTRRLMAEGYRAFTPVKYEPFILCATETIAYGVNLPADALFLENINWPRSRHKRISSMEPLTTNEYRNLVGRVGRHGHIKPGIIPTVIVNWPLGRSAKSRQTFGKKREEIAAICTSVPVLKIDCAELQGHLSSVYLKKLKDYPGPVGRFYQLALLHSYALNKKEPVSVLEMAEFLDETYTVRSFLSDAGEAGRERKEALLRNIEGYFRELSEKFGELIVVSSLTQTLERRYYPRELCLNLARNDTNPKTLLELDKFAEGFSKGSKWNEKELYALKLLFFTNLAAENKDIFSRIFMEPRTIKKSVLAKARTGRRAAKRFFRLCSDPVAKCLRIMGIGEAEINEMFTQLKIIVNSILHNHIKENFAALLGEKLIMATLRDALVNKVMTNIFTLLLWINGVTVKAILDKLGRGPISVTMAELSELTGIPLTPENSFEPLGGEEEGEEDEDGEDGDGEDGEDSEAGEEREGRENRGERENEDRVEGQGSDKGFGGQDYYACGEDEEENGEPGLQGDGKGNGEEPGSPPSRPEGERGKDHSLDTSAFNFRLCDKVALLLDSYLAYGTSSGKIGGELAHGINAMIRRVRHGLREEDITSFVEEIKDTRLYREEWLNVKTQGK